MTAGKRNDRADRRPPLGPDARKTLSTFGVITAVHTLATVLFSAALAVIIARAAHAGFAAVAAEHAHLKETSAPDVYRAYVEFAGSAQAQLEAHGGWLLGLGGLFGDADTITPGLIAVAVIALLVRSGTDYLLAVSAQPPERSLRFVPPCSSECSPLVAQTPPRVPARPLCCFPAA